MNSFTESHIIGCIISTNEKEAGGKYVLTICLFYAKKRKGNAPQNEFPRHIAREIK
jgi:hypothetical protein